MQNPSESPLRGQIAQANRVREREMKRAVRMLVKSGYVVVPPGRKALGEMPPTDDLIYYTRASEARREST